VTERSSTVGSGSGRVAAAIGDTGPLAPGQAGGYTATSDSSPNRRGVTWSIAITPIAGGDPGPANEPPAATPTVAGTGLDCVFDGSGSSDPDGSIVSYEWDFGDGNADTGESVTHVYDKPGDYTVTLTVTDDDGATDTATENVTVSAPENQAPSASFTVGCTGLECVFDGSGSSEDRKSTRLNSSHVKISYAVFCLKKKKTK